MANSAQPNAGYDPIQMLRDYLDDNPKTPGFFRNFLINRLGDQIKWYDKRSGEFKKRWEKYRKIIIILSASIPFLAGLIDQFPDSVIDYNIPLKLIIGLAGVTIAILEGLNALYKGQELYIEYRVTAEQLRQEFSYFLGQAGDYAGAGDTAYSKLVAKVEAIMGSQNNKWAEIARNTDRAALSEDISKAVEEHLRKYGYPQPGAPVATPPPPGDGGTETPPPTGDTASETEVPPPSDEGIGDDSVAAADEENTPPPPSSDEGIDPEDAKG